MATTPRFRKFSKAETEIIIEGAVVTFSYLTHECIVMEKIDGKTDNR
jgi:hypothetical protein